MISNDNSSISPDNQDSAKPSPTSRKAIASLILALSVPILSLLAALPSIFLGWAGLKDIRRSEGQLRGSGFAVGGILISVAWMIIAIPILMILPAINAAKEATRQQACMNNLRRLGFAAALHESTLKRYPLASDAPAPLVGERAARPGWSGEDGQHAGYSWQVKLLPYIEERILYDELEDLSEGFTRQAFDESLVRAGVADLHVSRIQVPAFRCLSFNLGQVATAPEYQQTKGEVALGNFVALPGTHINAENRLEENGVLVSAPMGSDGIRIRQISDGTAHTLLATESREQHYASWYDGQSSWVTALRTDLQLLEADQTPENLKIPADAAALNLGPTRPSGDIYFPAKIYAGQADREWGPSSMHGRVVVHVFVDGHASRIYDDIDPITYYMLVSRKDGGSPSREGL